MVMVTLKLQPYGGIELAIVLHHPFFNFLKTARFFVGGPTWWYESMQKAAVARMVQQTYDGYEPSGNSVAADVARWEEREYENDEPSQTLQYLLKKKKLSN